jgi:tetratricopeptide (TPR) repeat protein
MARFLAVSQAIRVGAIRCGLPVFVLFTALSMQGQEAASLRGTIRDSQGKPVAAASVELRTQDTTPAQSARTDPQGKYAFPALHGGRYALRVEMTGYGNAEISALFLGPKESKTVDLTLPPQKASALPAGSAKKPEFFDPPQFTVAGVTDTTNLGGHGSDTMVRTRETLAKETVSLGKTAPGARSAVAEGEASLRESVERDPASFEANHRLGKMLAESGRAHEAIPFLQRACDLKPLDYESAYDLALANYRAGNYQRALDDASVLLARSDTAEVQHLLGDAHESLGNSLEAVRHYERAAEMDPSELYIFDWGSELLLHHAPEPALEVFARGNRLFPGSARMLMGLGASWFARGSYDQAVHRICDASELNPADPTPYLFLGKMQSGETRPSEEAVEKLRRFAAQQPENPQANYYYAVGLWKLRKEPPDAASLAQVESLLHDAIRLDPKFAAAYLQLGILHSEEKYSQRAISDYQQAIQANPQMEEAHYRLAQAYRQKGDASGADAELAIYNRLTKESAQEAERERHEIRQFVYTLRDHPPAQAP